MKATKQSKEITLPNVMSQIANSLKGFGKEGKTYNDIFSFLSRSVDP